jgi:DNA mismatch repair protein MutL
MTTLAPSPATPVVSNYLPKNPSFVTETPILREEKSEHLDLQIVLPRVEEKRDQIRSPDLSISQEKKDTMLKQPDEAAQFQEQTEEQPWRLSGEVLNTYIVIEQGDIIYLIDKHAAHERMNFDRMKAGDFQPMAQTLLEPLVITLPPEEGLALLEQLSLFEEFGFALEDFGGGAIVVRQIPFDMDPGETESTLGELAKDLLSGNRIDPASARDHLLHTMACKAAIKGGQKNVTEELLAVAQAVMTGQVKYCPHGRPVAITLTRSQLERQFGRA